MSVFKRIVNLGRGAVSASFKDDPTVDPAFERELAEAARLRRAERLEAQLSRASAPAEAAQESPVPPETPEASAPELDELGMPKARKRTL